MLTISNLPTQDKYVDALTLGPVPTARSIKYVVANRSVFAKIWPQSKDGTIPAQTDELLITPETNIITDAMGIQFRSAVAGVPAQVIAQLLTPGDPFLGSGTPFSSTITSSGGIQPGVSSVILQQNGAAVGTEPIVDFVDVAGGRWALTDDPANTRVLVAAGGVTFGTFAAGPPAGASNGDLWVADCSAIQADLTWVFRFHSASSRWRFCGGAPLILIDISGFAVPNTGGAATVLVNSVAMARGGFYEVVGGNLSGQMNVGGSGTWTFQVGVGGVAVARLGAISQEAGFWSPTGCDTFGPFAVNAGQQISAMMTSNQTGTGGQVTLGVVPRWVA